MRLFAIAVLLLLAFASPSYADPYQLPSDEYRPDFFAGDANNLPVGAHLSKPQLIEWARRLPKVEVAMEEFARRGYIPRREGDDARQFSNPPMTTVALAYEKPGQLASDVHWAAPHILVVTSLSPTGEPSTDCTGRVLIYDSVKHLAFVGDSLAQYRASDPWFEVVDEGAGGTDDTNPKLLRANVRQRKPCQDDPNCWDPLMEFLACAAGRTFAVESAALLALPAVLPSTPVGWAVWAAGVGIGCLSANLLCLYDVFGHRGQR
jgi:hypothetical protein